jgi:hypothetical protein
MTEEAKADGPAPPSLPSDHPPVPEGSEASRCPALAAGLSEKRRAALLEGLGGAAAASGGGCPVRETPGFREVYRLTALLKAAAPGLALSVVGYLIYRIYTRGGLG